MTIERYHAAPSCNAPRPSRSPARPTPWAINLAAMGEAAAAGTPSDYKALVCVFLYGGNDYGNTLIPVDTASYAAYARHAARHSPTAASVAGARPRSHRRSRWPAAGSTRWRPSSRRCCRSSAANKMGVMLNVGTLVQPTTKTQYTNALGAAATQALLAQRPAIGVAIVGARRRGFGLGRPHGRSLRRRQRQRHLHLRQRLGQRRLPLRQARQCNTRSRRRGRSRSAA